ncbi:MAG: DegT/DnrJ/EryC1/StrS family aminotransferase [Deltaproteobacteria bacterium]|nr:DegT/DnrJ/EryC1/StrS family aminotransferase [Deltaproteobacteria bacterium]
MIPFIDLKTQFKHLEKDIRARMDAVFEHGKYIMGPEVKELEGKLAAFVGMKHCIGCASGTDALLIALMAMDVGPGDAVFTTPFTFIATAEVISLMGATPIFVDIDPKTFNMDPDNLQLAIRALKRRDSSIYPLPVAISQELSSITPKGMISVDLFGLSCDYDRINPIARREGLFVIEDAAQGFGGEYKGKRACSLADIGCTSFFPAKPLGCYGDGGAVFVDSDELGKKFASIRVHGNGGHKYDNTRIGLNARLDTLQAAILNAKFDIFPQEINLRNQVASKYTKLLAPCPTLHAPCVPEGYKSAWAQYSVLSDRKKQIQRALKEKGIPTAVYYPKPLHLQTAFSYLGYKEGDMLVSEDCSKRIFSLPMHPYLEDNDIERICRIIDSA